MAWLIGIGLGLSVMAFAIHMGFDRDRSFYPVVLIVTASYYVLFALGSPTAICQELLVLALFIAVAIAAYRKRPWIVAVALMGHAGFDMAHGALIADPGLPLWWPSFCAAFDATVALCLAAHQAAQSGRLFIRRRQVSA